ncbi:hypothetical protein AGDE_15683 [Angomonas deanei]|uniref:Amastin surface glycoprotein n=1 Tax=Angomonas deanei TaxID=59799 RepID=A0A7G2C0B0_9TRYP|nr:hypothetical protein AGDE_15683 [Angomonas deanei]CAD2212955.1 hypothetical protein, conserved [Angomonas deanei]|eukprot:EPY18656.1 hypothetical protein AGDE_15683 [Angomonas deanei]
MGICARVTVFIFLLLAVGCAIASCLTDVFRYEETLPGSDKTLSKVHLQYFKFQGDVLDSGKMDLPWSLANGDDCKQRMTIAGALCAAGGGVALIGMIFEAIYLACDNSCCFSCLILFICFVAFACEGVAFALSITAVMGDSRTCKPLENGYVEGFGLAVASCGLCFICIFIQLCA